MARRYTVVSKPKGRAHLVLALYHRGEAMGAEWEIEAAATDTGIWAVTRPWQIAYQIAADECALLETDIRAACQSHLRVAAR